MRILWLTCLLYLAACAPKEVVRVVTPPSPESQLKKEIAQSDLEKLNALERKLIAQARNGDLLSMLGLGFLYLENKVGKRDYRKALFWYQRASNKGSAEADYYLGWMAEKGYGQLPNHRKAAQYYQRAQEKNGKAAYRLAVLYEKGSGVPQDRKAFFKHLYQAEKAGNADAIEKLGVLHLEGRGVAQNHRKALEYFLSAGAKGSALSLYLLGTMHAEGRGVEKNTQEAYFWFLVAAALGEREAQRSLKSFEKKIESEELVTQQDRAAAWLLTELQRNE